MTQSRTMLAAALAVSLALLIVLLGTRSAHADDAGKARAQILLSEGNKLLAGGDNGGALAKFEAAYDAYPSPSLLLNIGTTLRALGRNAEAANAYARWVRAKQNPERLAEVEEALAELDSKVAGLEISVNQPGAVVTVDGKTISTELLKGVVRLEPGRHVVAASKRGFSAAKSEVSISAGKKETVKLELEAEGRTVASKPLESTEPSGMGEEKVSSGGASGRGLRIAGLSAAGVGLLSIAIGVKFGLDARSLESELDDEGDRLNDAGLPWTEAFLDKQAEGDSAEKKFIIFTAVGGAAIVAGGVLYVLGRSAANDESERAVAITPTLGPDSAGWAISGSF